MEKITTLNYSKIVPAAVFKKSEKLEARDVDQEEPNKFLAYVDDGAESHDVMIAINAKKEVVDSSCDCDNKNGFCVHKLALMRYMVTKK